MRRAGCIVLFLLSAAMSAANAQKALTDQQSEVTGKWRLGIVDRLVLTNQATQLAGQTSRASLERRIFQHFIRLYGERGPCRCERKEQNYQREPAHFSYSAACIADFAAGFGAPTRNLRSDSDNAPPSIITTAPSQINMTIGL